jgi:glycosyltransferase involved in cell wall biosynthesis
LTLRTLEAATYYAGIRSTVARLHRRFPFELIHAHFTYPDGVVATMLGRKYDVPVLITEQAPWGPWVAESALVRRQMVFAARNAAFHIAISRAVKASIEQYTGPSERLRVIPDGIDASVFTLPETDARRDGQILFVGVIREVKGVDVLIRAMQLLSERRADAHLVLVGESYYAKYREEYDRLRGLTSELGLDDRVTFAGPKPLGELVQIIQQSAVLVLPSRAESLGMVLVEALACGTPVVATRCGGPEDIVTDDVGVLVATDDAPALAQGIEAVLERRREFDRAALRAHALERFEIGAVTERVGELYRAALDR